MLDQSLACARATAGASSRSGDRRADVPSFMISSHGVLMLLPAANRPRGKAARTGTARDLRGVGRRIVLRRDLDDVAADDVDSGETAQDAEHFPRRETAHFGRPGARAQTPGRRRRRRSSRTRARRHDVARFATTAATPIACTSSSCSTVIPLSYENSHRNSAPPRMPIWIERSGSSTPGEHRLPERSAVMELRALVDAGRVAVRVDVHHPTGRSRPTALRIE
jgi:hypothetical protein